MARLTRRLVERAAALSSPSRAPSASALERRQQNISGGLRRRARTVLHDHLSKCCLGRITKNSSLSCMADRNQTTALRVSKTYVRVVMDDTPWDIIIITHIPIMSISMSMHLHGPPLQPGPSAHARGVHILTTLVGCSRGVEGTMVGSGLARDDRQGRSIRSTRPTRPTRLDKRMSLFVPHALTPHYITHVPLLVLVLIHRLEFLFFHSSVFYSSRLSHPTLPW